MYTYNNEILPFNGEIIKKIRGVRYYNCGMCEIESKCKQNNPFKVRILGLCIGQHFIKI